MTDKQWLQVAERIMPHIEELFNISEEIGNSFSISIGGNYMKAMVHCYDRDSVDCNHDLMIYHSGCGEIRSHKSDCILKRFETEIAPIGEQEDRDKEKYTRKL